MRTLWEAVFELWENVLAIIEIETSTQQDLAGIRASLSSLQQRQQATTARLLRLEARIRVVETRLPQ